MVDMDGLYGTVGARIRNLREERRLSQEALAKLVGLGRTSITNIERGHQRMLLHTFFEICEALGAEPQHLLPRDEPIGDASHLEGDLPESLSDTEREWIRTVVRGVPQVRQG